MEKVVFLILVLLHPAKPTVETHIAIEMPSESRCEQMKHDAFTYGTYIDIRESGTYRTPLKVDGAYCEVQRVDR